MRAALSLPRLTYLLSVAALVVLFVPTFSRSLLSTRPDWALTELLINYRGGFVRRGLLGELLLMFCNATGISVYQAVGGLFLATFLFLIAAMARLVWPLRDRSPALAALLLLSPALLLFPVHEWPAYHRKESFIIALLLGHALVIRRFLRGQLDWPALRAFYLVGLMPALLVMMFIHEVQVAFLPAHLCLTFVALRQRQIRANWLYALYGLPVVLAGVMLRYNGSPEMIAPILQSLAGHVAIKPGSEQAIGALGWSMARFWEVSLMVLGDPSRLAFYVLAYVLAVVIPAVALCRVLRRDALNDAYLSPRWLTAFVLLICLAPLPLVVLWSDLGRLIHLTAFSVTAFLLAMPLRPADVAQPAPARFWPRAAVAGLVAAYVTLWTLPHFLPPTPVVKSGLLRSANRSMQFVFEGERFAKRNHPDTQKPGPTVASVGD